MKKEISTTTTIRLHIKGTDHDLTPEEAKAIIEKLREAVNEKPSVIIREVEKLVPRFERPYPLKPPFGWPDIICKTDDQARLSATPGGLSGQMRISNLQG